MKTIYMNLRFPLFLLVFLLLISCSNKKVVEEGVKTIELSKSKDILPISSFISELDYLELKINEVNIEIGEILDIKELGNDLIVKQRRAGELSFIRFTKKGDFINEIVNNKKGKIAQPFDIIQYKNDYAVLAENGIHIVSKTGKYKTKLVTGEMAGSSLFTVNNAFYTLNETSNNQLVIDYAADKKTEKVTFPDVRYRKMIYSFVTETAKNNYHLVSSFSDKVSLFSNNKLQTAYAFDSGEIPMFSDTWKMAEKLEGKEKQRFIFETQNVLVKNYLENKGYIFINYWVGSSSSTVVINKTNWESLYFAHGVNNLDGGIWDKPLHLSDKNELYVPLTAYKISGHKISNKRDKGFEELQAQIANSGNPVIMKCLLETSWD